MPCNSSFEINEIACKNGQTPPLWSLIESFRTVKVHESSLFQLYIKMLDIFQCLVEFFFIRTTTAQFECYISC